jgi:hypothetical protein
MPSTAATLRLGLRENIAQFSLLVLVNAFVGAMVGMERSILPAIREGRPRVGDDVRGAAGARRPDAQGQVMDMPRTRIVAVHQAVRTTPEAG